MLKTIRALRPYKPRDLKFAYRQPAYEAWEAIGGSTTPACHAPCGLRRYVYKHSWPPFRHSRREARLCFAEVVSLRYEAFPSCLLHEIVPIVWDAWPSRDASLVAWLRQQRVRTCLLTSSEAVARLRPQLPGVCLHFMPEGVDEARYPMGLPLIERPIDLYTYGRLQRELYDFPHEGLRVERGGDDATFHRRLQEAKVIIAVPNCDVNARYTGGQETLTLRYWECMLSGAVLVGRAPRELTELIGYDPTVPLRRHDFPAQLREICRDIASYQPLVARNRRAALSHGSWTVRMAQVREWLKGQGYV